MDIERLKELREETEQYRAVADDRCMSTNYEDDLLDLIDEAIARHMITCPGCKGSGVYQEYDEYDRYNESLCKLCANGGCYDRERNLMMFECLVKLNKLRRKENER